MIICNACRYCEGYCAVFPSMERRLAFPEGDLHYLANLCHNCGECLYACQYAPPHEFAINVPRVFAQLRLDTYEQYAWPRALAGAFRRHGVATALGLSLAMTAVMLGVTAAMGNPEPAARGADFYAVLPHSVMIGLFGSVFAFVLVALAVGYVRFQRDIGPGPRPRDASGPAHPRGRRQPAVIGRALRDILTLRNLHGHSADCTYAGEEARSPWRRWFHHCTSYGFLLCFASTSVAAVYHWLGWPAPYPYASLPVVLGTLGGFGLLIGPAGLYAIGRLRDPDTADPAQQPLDRGFLVLLFLTSLTGIALLILRETAVMPPLLVVHLGAVLALFVTLPYGKFVHGVYRGAALVRFNAEEAAAG